MAAARRRVPTGRASAVHVRRTAGRPGSLTAVATFVRHAAPNGVDIGAKNII